MEFGRKGERVANTPTRVLPPSFGGSTVGDQPSRSARSNCQMSQMCEKPSIPRSASGLRNSGSKTMVDSSASASPLWRGTPNFVGKSVWILATICMDRLLFI